MNLTWAARTLLSPVSAQTVIERSLHVIRLRHSPDYAFVDGDKNVSQAITEWAVQITQHEEMCRALCAPNKQCQCLRDVVTPMGFTGSANVIFAASRDHFEEKTLKERL